MCPHARAHAAAAEPGHPAARAMVRAGWIVGSAFPGPKFKCDENCNQISPVCPLLWRVNQKTLGIESTGDHLLGSKGNRARDCFFLTDLVGLGGKAIPGRS